MIIGKAILDRGFIRNGSESNLKNSTYDITVGEIFPVGKGRHNDGRPQTYFLEPREMVWVLSKEEFHMPSTVTGLATLRTSFTREGILALNVGIIDPLFKGPVSTALINFSDRPRRIDVGEKVFRVAFFEHDDVSAYKPKVDESIDRVKYIKTLETASHADFSPSFLNIPTFDDDYYASRLKGILISTALAHKWVTGVIGIIVFITVWYLLEDGLWQFLTDKIDWINTKLASVTIKK